ncbi:hypothetical protein DCAR_0414522 [Daucus carota subsp. sativus]|uniref:Uncharacterized protein n=1 Tax=Daucus carota subsp. sativus TaxID=79200 RepID=A0A175YAT0_DAUCS|nr:hypothetical protein DCAR_0414522 [Daucus carota subsp. sativus]
MPRSWPEKSWIRAPVCGDHVLTVLSVDEVPRRAPLSENLTAEMARLWVVRVCGRV